MDGDPLLIITYLVGLALLVALNGLFVSSEYAMVKVKVGRISALAEDGNIRAKLVKRILNNLSSYLSACQLGITLASLALGWLAAPLVAERLTPLFSNFLPEYVIQSVSILVTFMLITAVHTTLGEQVPKSFAQHHAESMALWSAIPIYGFYVIMYPFLWLLNGISHWTLRRLGVEPNAEYEEVHTDEEIREIMQESHKGGYLDNTELTFMDNIFEFSETHAREIMIPRTEMSCIYTTIPYEETKRLVVEEMYTRYPVCDPDKDNIIGFVHIKDLMKAGDQLTDIRDITRPIMTVPESVPISTVLKQMQKNRTEMALLIDEYGGTSGLVTVKDILEEIVGEIHDEFDQSAPVIDQRDDATHSVDGLLLIDEFNDYFGTALPSDDFDTIGGWVYAQLEMPPKKYQSLSFGHYEFIIEDVDHMRISRLIVKRLEDQQDEELQVVS